MGIEAPATLHCTGLPAHIPDRLFLKARERDTRSITIARKGIQCDQQLDDGHGNHHRHGLQQHHRERPSAHATGGWNTTTAPLGIT